MRTYHRSPTVEARYGRSGRLGWLSRPAVQPAGARPTGNEPPEQPAGARPTGNEPPEQQAGARPTGNEPPEQRAGARPTGNEPPEQQAGAQLKACLACPRPTLGRRPRP